MALCTTVMVAIYKEFKDLLIVLNHTKLDFNNKFHVITLNCLILMYLHTLRESDYSQISAET